MSNYSVSNCIVNRPASYSTKRGDKGFTCATCSKILKTTSTFKTHVTNSHGGTVKTFNLKNVTTKRKSDFTSKPNTKLPKVYNKSEIQQAVDTSKEDTNFF